jgi:hypothetical protein
MKKIYTGAGPSGNVLGLRCSTGWLALILITLFLSSCRVTRDRCNQLYPPIITMSTDSVITVRETIYDTTVAIQPDEGSLSALFECDSANNVLFKELSAINGKRIRMNLISQRNDRALKAIFTCNVDSQGVYVAFKARDTTSTFTHHETKIQIVEAPKHYTKSEMFVLSVGPWCIGFVGLLILAIIIYICWKVFTVATPQGAAISAGGGLIKTAMNFFRGGAILIMFVSLCSFTPLIRKGKWVYWYEVNSSGQKVMQVGKVLGKDIGQGTYRIAADDFWKMHIKKEELNLVPKK